MTSNRYKKSGNKSKSRRSVRSDKSWDNKTIFSIFTILIALWGAVLSSWNFYQSRLDNTPRLFIRMDAYPQGRLDNENLAGDISISVTNIGANTISVGPYLHVLLADSRSGEKQEVTAFFNFEELDAPKRLNSPAPVTLHAGESAIAKTAIIKNRIAFDPMDYHSVVMQLSTGEKFIAHFSAERRFSIRKDPKTKEFVGWSAGSVAERL